MDQIDSIRKMIEQKRVKTGSICKMGNGDTPGFAFTSDLDRLFDINRLAEDPEYLAMSPEEQESLRRYVEDTRRNLGLPVQNEERE